MILVTLGTQDKEFTRLLKKIDELIDSGKIKDEVIVQAGYTKYESKNMKIFDYLPSEDFKTYIKNADYVICHAGVGTIFDCINYHKKAIAVVRLAKYKEHSNDHQIEIAREFGKSNYIIPVYDVEDLEDAINKIDDFIPSEYKSSDRILNMVDEFITNNGKRSIKNVFIKNKEVLLYLLFGILTTLISLITYYLLVYTVLNPKVGLELQIANVLSWIVSVMFAYYTNRKYVFNSKNSNKLKEASSFITSRLITLLMDMIVMFIGVTIFKLNDKVFKIISQVLVIIANYILSKLVVFKSKEK